MEFTFSDSSVHKDAVKLLKIGIEQFLKSMDGKRVTKLIREFVLPLFNLPSSYITSSLANPNEIKEVGF
jgi:hypothetical protein